MNPPDFADVLKKHNLKVTPQRIEIIKCLEELKESHPTFNDLYSKLKTVNPSISRSTLHANLKLFENHDLIISFNHNNETHYDLNLSLHINIITTKGEIMDLMDKNIEDHLAKIKTLIKSKYGKIKKFNVLVEIE